MQLYGIVCRTNSYQTQNTGSLQVFVFVFSIDSYHSSLIMNGYGVLDRYAFEIVNANDSDNLLRVVQVRDVSSVFSQLR